MLLKLNGNKRHAAAEWFFKTAGMTPMVENKEDPFKKVVKLIKRLEKHMDNRPVYNDIKVCEKMDSSYGRNINGEYLYSEVVVGSPLADIYKINKTIFKELTSQMLELKIKNVLKLMDTYEKKSSDAIFVEGVGLVSYQELLPSCQIMLDELNALMDEIYAL